MSNEPIYRAMLPDGDGNPRTGAERNMLGVRPGVDVKDAKAGPGKGGMSVFVGSYKNMSPGLLPEPFGGLNLETLMYEAPSDTFSEESWLAIVDVHPTKRHAHVEARVDLPVDEFQGLIGATVAAWSVTPPPPRSV